MLCGSIHFCIRPVRRACGQSAVARVAYQTASCILDPRTCDRHDYRHKSAEVGGAWLFVGKNEFADSAKFANFWSAVETHHKRKDAVPARTATVALPLELTPAQNLQLMQDYGKWLADEYDVGVQVTAHKLDSGNPHFHVAMTVCGVGKDGVLTKKVEALDPISARKKGLTPAAEHMRGQWASMVNDAFAECGSKVMVDHRSYKRCGIDILPTKHEGAARHSQHKSIAKPDVLQLNDAIFEFTELTLASMKKITPAPPAPTLWNKVVDAGKSLFKRLNRSQSYETTMLSG